MIDKSFLFIDKKENFVYIIVYLFAFLETFRSFYSVQIKI